MEHNRSRPPGRILALDPGRSRTGIALSDPEGCAATPLETVSGPPGRVVDRVLELIASHQVTAVVIGLPRLPSGDEGEIAGLSRLFAERIERAAGVPVVLRDETLTSWEAEECLRAQGRPARRPEGGRGRNGGTGPHGRRRRGARTQPGEVDRIAAAIILQEYLDELRRAGVAPADRAQGDPQGDPDEPARS